MKYVVLQGVSHVYLIATLWCTWCRHQMEIFSALLAICTGNSPVAGEFPPQRPVMQSFDVFFDLRLNQQLSRQWRGRWFETPSRHLWRHCNEYDSSTKPFLCSGKLPLLLSKGFNKTWKSQTTAAQLSTKWNWFFNHGHDMEHQYQFINPS